MGYNSHFLLCYNYWNPINCTFSSKFISRFICHRFNNRIILWLQLKHLGRNNHHILHLYSNINFSHLHNNNNHNHRLNLECHFGNNCHHTCFISLHSCSNPIICWLMSN
jgi:hypothetical protein